MSFTWKSLVGIGAALILSGHLNAQGLVTQRSLSLAMAKAIAEGSIAECKAKGYNTSAQPLRDQFPYQVGESVATTPLLGIYIA